MQIKPGYEIVLEFRANEANLIDSVLQRIRRYFQFSRSMPRMKNYHVWVGESVYYEIRYTQLLDCLDLPEILCIDGLNFEHPEQIKLEDNEVVLFKRKK